jgi:hypothetical protein
MRMGALHNEVSFAMRNFTTLRVDTGAQAAYYFNDPKSKQGFY